MAAHAHRKEYVIIFVWLTVLTAVEVAVAYTPIAKPLLVSALVLLAVAKAALVAYFFMHLKQETPIMRKTISFCLAIPVFYAVVLISEAAWRMLP